MNKLLRNVMVFAMAGALATGMNVTAFAETSSNLNTQTENVSDTSTINLLKDYVNGSATQTNTKSPAETFTFTIERYGLWNVGDDGNGAAKYTKDNMPTFENGSQTEPTNTFTIHANAETAGNTGTDKISTALRVPTYDAVGDYWYKVTETNNHTAGVLYGTNDSNTEDVTTENGGHAAVYYIHVQVTNAADLKTYIRTVTLHKTAPDVAEVKTNEGYENWYADNNKNTEGQLDKKVNDIQNKYYAGSLNITKKVTGNAGDKNELFEVVVTLKNESGASMNSDITYKNFFDAKGTETSSATSINWTDTVSKDGETTKHTNETKEIHFYVKDETTVTFDNIPYGVTYTIKETQPEDDKYTHSFEQTKGDPVTSFNGEKFAADTVTEEQAAGEATDKAAKWNAASAIGSITDDSDTVTITNTKQSTIDVGVITSNAPYVALLLLVAAGAFVFAHWNKNRIEE